MGRIQVRNYDDANGDKKYITEIVADDVEFLTPKGIGGSGTPNAFQQDFVSADNEDFSPLSDDEMPF